MSDDAGKSPIPWGLVEHVRRTSTGRTTMQISLPVELRARMAQAALDLRCSKLALIRSVISQFLMAHEENRSRGQEQAYQAVETAPVPPVGASSLVPDRVPDPPSEATVAVPEPEPEIPPVVEPEQVPAVPEQSSAPKRSRAKKGRAQ